MNKHFNLNKNKKLVAIKNANYKV